MRASSLAIAYCCSSRAAARKTTRTSSIRRRRSPRSTRSTPSGCSVPEGWTRRVRRRRRHVAVHAAADPGVLTRSAASRIFERTPPAEHRRRPRRCATPSRRRPGPRARPPRSRNARRCSDGFAATLLVNVPGDAEHPTRDIYVIRSSAARGSAASRSASTTMRCATRCSRSVSRSSARPATPARDARARGDSRRSADPRRHSPSVRPLRILP